VRPESEPGRPVDLKSEPERPADLEPRAGETGRPEPERPADLSRRAAVIRSLGRLNLQLTQNESVLEGGFLQVVISSGCPAMSRPHISFE